MLNDILANTLNTIYMASKAGKDSCIVKPVSKVSLEILKIMNEKGYIGSFEVKNDNRGGIINVNLIGALNKCGAIKPRFPVGLDNFEKFEKRYLPAKDFGFLVVSTSQGIMIHNNAKSKKIGGKLLAYVY